MKPIRLASSKLL